MFRAELALSRKLASQAIYERRRNGAHQPRRPMRRAFSLFHPTNRLPGSHNTLRKAHAYNHTAAPPARGEGKEQVADEMRWFFLYRDPLVRKWATACVYFLMVPAAWSCSCKKRRQSSSSPEGVCSCRSVFRGVTRCIESSTWFKNISRRNFCRLAGLLRIGCEREVCPQYSTGEREISLSPPYPCRGGTTGSQVAKARKRSSRLNRTMLHAGGGMPLETVP